MMRILLAVTLGTQLLFSTAVEAAAMPTLVTGKDLVTQRELRFELSHAAKASVVVFLSARCPCSASHEIALAKLHAEFENRGFRFIGIHSNSDEDVKEAREHFQKTALPFPIVRDDGALLANSFGALKTPHVFVLDPTGAPLFQGGVDDSHVAGAAKKFYLRDALVAIAEGRSPLVTEARSLGCVIKRP